ncbi:MAG: hypothetical protein KJ949_01875 [Nanoarchaeota archaeon]|nr:hypothetical protein [Nanoarchaeota archaeon]MBU4308278.1 hypothetical protein [Nanoarchaeota archaeon]
MSNLSIISEVGGRKPWLIWVFLLIVVLLIIAGFFVWNLVSGDGGQSATNLGEQMFGNTSLPI